MRLALLTIPLLLLLGCSGSRHQHDAATLTDWESNHPYARLEQNTTLPSGENTRVYTDRFPRGTASGAYSAEDRTYLVNSRDGAIILVAWTSVAQGWPR